LTTLCLFCDLAEQGREKGSRHTETSWMNLFTEPCPLPMQPKVI